MTLTAAQRRRVRIEEGSTTIITGTLGGGKSAHAVELLMEWLASGLTVVTNIEVYPEEIARWLKEEYGKIFDPDRLRVIKAETMDDFHQYAVRGAAFVIDEAALDVGARDWAKHSDAQFNFVILVRKLRIHLVLIAQDANDIDKRIRQKMQTEVHCRSLMNMWTVPGEDPIFKLPIFVRVRYTIQLGKKPQRTGCKFQWKSKAFGLYNSHALHGKKAKDFESLGEASDIPLESVTYDRAAYAAIVVSAAIGGAVTSLLCQ